MKNRRSFLKSLIFCSILSLMLTGCTFNATVQRSLKDDLSSITRDSYFGPIYNNDDLLNFFISHGFIPDIEELVDQKSSDTNIKGLDTYNISFLGDNNVYRYHIMTDPNASLDHYEIKNGEYIEGISCAEDNCIIDFRDMFTVHDNIIFSKDFDAEILGLIEDNGLDFMPNHQFDTFGFGFFIDHKTIESILEIMGIEVIDTMIEEPRFKDTYQDITYTLADGSSISLVQIYENWSDKAPLYSDEEIQDDLIRRFYLQNDLTLVDEEEKEHDLEDIGIWIKNFIITKCEREDVLKILRSMDWMHYDALVYDPGYYVYNIESSENTFYDLLDKKIPGSLDSETFDSSDGHLLYMMTLIHNKFRYNDLNPEEFVSFIGDLYPIDIDYLVAKAGLVIRDQGKINKNDYQEVLKDQQRSNNFAITLIKVLNKRSNTDDYIIITSIDNKTETYKNLLADGTYELDVDGNIVEYTKTTETLEVFDIYGNKTYTVDEFFDQYSLDSYITLDLNFGRDFKYQSIWGRDKQK